MQRAYTIDEFSKIYKLGRTKIYDEIKKRQLKAVKLGAKTIIRADDAEAWLASLPASGEGA